MTLNKVLTDLVRNTDSAIVVTTTGMEFYHDEFLKSKELLNKTVTGIYPHNTRFLKIYVK